jgi:SAM-dependent methyltransferase
MTQQEFAAAGLALSREAGVTDGVHAYFVQHYPRLYKLCRLFRLLESNLGDVLEIGPFFSYTPFLLQPNAASYAVLEGDDAVAYPLKPLYQKRGISAQFVDLFEIFGPIHSAIHRLAYADASFNTILCWGTMEHFNFNPVKFVRELHRVLKPGGRVYISVPNRASFQNLLDLLFGGLERDTVDRYYTYENMRCNGKIAFYGFHWREYSYPELAHLFAQAGFTVRSAGTSVAFQVHARTSIPRHVARGATQVLARLLPRYGTDANLVAEK